MRAGRLSRNRPIVLSRGQPRSARHDQSGTSVARPERRAQAAVVQGTSLPSRVRWPIRARLPANGVLDSEAMADQASPSAPTPRRFTLPSRRLKDVLASAAAVGDFTVTVDVGRTTSVSIEELPSGSAGTSSWSCGPSRCPRVTFGWPGCTRSSSAPACCRTAKRSWRTRGPSSTDFRRRSPCRRFPTSMAGLPERQHAS